MKDLTEIEIENIRRDIAREIENLNQCLDDSNMYDSFACIHSLKMLTEALEEKINN